jgi:hypothetical protein
MRVVQISGLRGILMVVFIGICLIAGFIGFPAIVAMNIWNYIANYIAIPTINITQGLMLWGIVAVTGYIINEKQKYLFTFTPKNKLSEEEVKRVLENIKRQSQVIKKAENSEKKDKENV